MLGKNMIKCKFIFTLTMMIFCWMAAIGVLVSATLIIPAGLTRLHSRVVQEVPDPRRKVVAYLVEEGDFGNLRYRGELFVYSIYLAPAGKKPGFDRWYRFLRWLNVEPATLVARGKYWRTDCVPNGSTIFSWETPFILNVQFCGGFIRHFSTPVNVVLGKKDIIEVNVNILFYNHDS